MHAEPANHIGDKYYREFYPGEAEDMAEVLSADAFIDVPLGAFYHVVKTLDFSSLDPDLLEHKYYVHGIGMVKAVDLKSGEEEIWGEFIPGE